MAEELQIAEGDKHARYQVLVPQIQALLADETDSIANLANVAAAIWQTFGFLWVGFYRVQGDELVLGPFQGPLACTRIAKGAGVCGTAWQEKTTLVVPDVEAFPGHIACSSASRSEIVVPVFDAQGTVSYVLDVDSDALATFDHVDQQYLEEIAKLISQHG